jgi:hypothetical protein
VSATLSRLAKAGEITKAARGYQLDHRQPASPTEDTPAEPSNAEASTAEPSVVSETGAEQGNASEMPSEQGGGVGLASPAPGEGHTPAGAGMRLGRGRTYRPLPHSEVSTASL